MLYQLLQLLLFKTSHRCIWVLPTGDEMSIAREEEVVVPIFQKDFLCNVNFNHDSFLINEKHQNLTFHEVDVVVFPERDGPAALPVVPATDVFGIDAVASTTGVSEDVFYPMLVLPVEAGDVMFHKRQSLVQLRLGIQIHDRPLNFLRLNNALDASTAD